MECQMRRYIILPSHLLDSARTSHHLANQTMGREMSLSAEAITAEMTCEYLRPERDILAYDYVWDG